MIYVTGDTHGDFKRFQKFKKPFFKHKDYLIVCGDFGFIWDGSDEEKKQLEKFKKLKCTVLFIEGTHDNLNELKNYPLKEMWGGRVREINENLYHLERGNVFTIEDKKIFAMGGGQSKDNEDRIAGVSWWPEEMPTIDEFKFAESNLYENHYNVDYIVTHVSPHGDFTSNDKKLPKDNPLFFFFSQVAKHINFTHWYFGSEHVDKNVTSKLTCVFENILPIDGTK